MRADGGPVKVFANADLSQHCPLTVEVEVLDEQFQPLPAGESFRLQVNYGGGLRPEDAKLYVLYVAGDG